MKRKALPSKNSNSAEKADAQEAYQQVTISHPKEFDVQEVEELSDDQSVEIEDGGTIDLGKVLDPLEKIERSRMRTHISGWTLSLLTVWILTGLIHFLLTGNSFLLVTSSPMGIPALIIIKYYFRDD